MTMKAPEGRPAGAGGLRPRALLRPQVRRAQRAGSACGWTSEAAPDWDEMAEMIAESYCLTAPKRLAARLEAEREAEPEG